MRVKAKKLKSLSNRCSKISKHLDDRDTYCKAMESHCISEGEREHKLAKELEKLEYQNGELHRKAVEAGKSLYNCLDNFKTADDCMENLLSNGEYLPDLAEAHKSIDLRIKELQETLDAMSNTKRRFVSKKDYLSELIKTKQLTDKILVWKDYASSVDKLKYQREARYHNQQLEMSKLSDVIQQERSVIEASETRLEPLLRENEIAEKLRLKSESLMSKAAEVDKKVKDRASREILKAFDPNSQRAEGGLSEDIIALVDALCKQILEERRLEVKLAGLQKKFDDMVNENVDLLCG